MSGVNKAIIIGRLGQDPEIRSLASGKSVANLSVATSEQWTGNDGEKKEKTEWHRIVCFDKLADIASKYLTKGRQVYIEGKIQTRQWEDKDGNKRWTTEIVAFQIQFLGDRPANGEAKPQGQTNGQQQADPEGPPSDDNYPF